ncbi:MAG: hypothetical protein ABT940_05945 [Alphaproteobacteria bacterium]
MGSGRPRHFFLFPLLLVLTLVLTASGSLARPAAPVAELSWKTYVNSRYGYSLCYPEGVFVPQGESANSDGQSFLAKDGARLIVYGTHNVLSRTLEDQKGEAESRLVEDSGKITYRVLRKSWFAISGESKDHIFYVRTHKVQDDYISFELFYNASLAALYDKIVDRMSSCFVSLPR